MKHLRTFLALVLCVAGGISMGIRAQMLEVTSGGVRYYFNADEVGEMPFNDGKELTIQGKTFPISDIASIRTTNVTPFENTVHMYRPEKS